MATGNKAANIADNHVERAKHIIELVYNEVIELRHHEEIWDHLNGELPKRGNQIIHEAVTRWYVDSQAAGVRRMTATHGHDKLNLPAIITLLRQDTTRFDQSELDEDLESLSLATAPISRWADEHVAHLTDPERHSVSPNFNDLRAAIEAISAFLKKYYLSLTGAQLDDTRPVIPYDWKLK